MHERFVEGSSPLKIRAKVGCVQIFFCIIVERIYIGKQWCTNWSWFRQLNVLRIQNSCSPFSKVKRRTHSPRPTEENCSFSYILVHSLRNKKNKCFPLINLFLADLWSTKVLQTKYRQYTNTIFASWKCTASCSIKNVRIIYTNKYQLATFCHNFLCH